MDGGAAAGIFSILGCTTTGIWFASRWVTRVEMRLDNVSSSVHRGFKENVEAHDIITSEVRQINSRVTTLEAGAGAD